MAWEFYEEIFLIENYGKISLRSIAHKLNRSIQSVRGKVARLDCLKKNSHNWWSLKEQGQLWEWEQQKLPVREIYRRFNGKFTVASISTKLRLLRRQYGQN